MTVTTNLSATIRPAQEPGPILARMSWSGATVGDATGGENRAVLQMANVWSRPVVAIVSRVEAENVSVDNGYTQLLSLGMFGGTIKVLMSTAVTVQAVRHLSFGSVPVHLPAYLTADVQSLVRVGFTNTNAESVTVRGIGYVVDYNVYHEMYRAQWLY